MSSKGLQQLRIAIWGATGATGSELLRQCLDEPRITEVRIFTRRPHSTDDPRVKQVLVDNFRDLSGLHDELRGIDAAFWCLGVSQLAVPDEDRYREITRDFAVSAARVLQEKSPNVLFHFLSGIGADPSGRSRMMWARVKGETEVALAALRLRRLVIWRPAYIHVVAGREHPSFGDRLVVHLSPIFRLIPNMANSTVSIAHAMINETMEGSGNATYGPKDINKLATKYEESQATSHEPA